MKRGVMFFVVIAVVLGAPACGPSADSENADAAADVTPQDAREATDDGATELPADAANDPGGADPHDGAPPDPAAEAGPADALDAGDAETAEATGEVVVPPPHATLTGRVLVWPSGVPAANGFARVQGGPEQVATGADGSFSLELEAVRRVLIVLEAPGHLPQYRHAAPAAGDVVRLDDARLLPADPRVTSIAPDDTNEQVARNEAGTIRVRFPPGTVTEPLDVVITGFPAAATLPAPLPASSQFTFAVDLQPDGATFAGEVILEAVSPHALPVSLPIPVGRFDPQTGAWHHVTQGRVVQKEGVPTIEARLTHFSSWDCNDPAGVEDDETEEKERDDTEEEDDCNKAGDGGSHLCYGSGELLDWLPLLSLRTPDGAFTPSLRYRGSHAFPTRRIGRIWSTTTPDKFDHLRARLDVAGVRHETHLAVPAGGVEIAASYLAELRGPTGSFLATGSYGYTYKLSKFMKGTFYSAACFGCPATTSTNVATGDPVEYGRSIQGRVVVRNETGSPFGAGWTLSEVDEVRATPEGRFLGLPGRGASAAYEPDRIALRVVGTGEPGWSDDGTPALEAQVDTVTALAVDADDRLIFADQNGRVVRRITAEGRLETLAGARGEFDEAGPLAGPATRAALPQVHDVAVEDADHLLLATTFGVLRVDLAARTLAPVATCDADDLQGSDWVERDGACLTVTTRVDALGGGALLAADHYRVKRIGADGSVVTLLGAHSRDQRIDPTYYGQHLGEGAPAADSRLWPILDVLPLDAGRWLVSSLGYGVYEVPAAGPVRRLAGRGPQPYSLWDPRAVAFARQLRTTSLADGGDAREHPLVWPFAMVPGPDGSVYVLDVRVTDSWCGPTASQAYAGMFAQTVVKRLDPDGRVHVVAGARPEPQACYFFDSDVTRADKIAALLPKGGLASRQWLLADLQGGLLVQDKVWTPQTPLQGGERPSKVFSAYSPTGDGGKGVQALGGDLAVDSVGALYVVAARSTFSDDDEISPWQATASHVVTRLAVEDAEGRRVHTAPDGRVLYQSAEGLETWEPSRGRRARYDGQGRMTSVEQPGRGRLDVERDAAGRVAALRATGGSRLEFAYDATGRLASLSDDLGRTVQVQIDGNGDLVSVTDPVGRTRSFGYDDQHRVISKASNTGAATTLGYGAGGRIALVSHPDGSSTAYTPYANQSVLEPGVSDPATLRVAPPPPGDVTISGPGGTWRREMSAAGTTRSKTDPLGRVTLVSDAQQRGTSLGGLHETSTRADARAPAKVTFPSELGGSVSTVLRDPLGRVRSRAWTTTFTDATTRYAYVGDSSRLAETRAVLSADEEVRRSYEHDSQGRLIGLTDPDGVTLALSRDAAGRLSAVTGADGLVTTLERDADGWVQGLLRGGTWHTTLTRDAAHRVVAVTTPAGTTSWTYDDVGRRASATDPAGGLVTFATDATLGWHRVTDALGNVTTTQTDETGRVSTVTWPWGEVVTSTWQEGERSDVHAGGERITTNTDERGRPLMRWLLVGSDTVDTLEFTYGGVLGFLESVANDTAEVVFTRDPLGVLTKRQVKGEASVLGPLANKSIGYTWAGGGARLEKLGTLANAGLVFAHDPGGMRASGFSLGTLFACTLEYDAAGRPVRRACGTGEPERSLLRDDLARPAHLIYTRGDDDLLTIDLERDARGFVVARTFTTPTDSWTEHVEVDAFGQVLAATYPAPHAAEDFAWDPMGNPSWGEVDVAPGNQASGVAGVAYTYDPRGRVVERLDPALGARDELDWDPMNRLVGWRRFTPADAPEPSAEATYAWDGLGNLLVRTVGDDTWRYFWSQGRLVTVWRNNSEEFVLHRDPSDGSLAFARYGGDLFAVLTDEAGTPVELRDENGAEAGSRRHAVFGARLVDTFTAPLPLGFTGALTDDASGLLLLGRRVYDPRTGRFLSPDPAGYADGWNLYRYARNNPLAWADPTGLESEPCCDDAMKQQIDKLQDEIDFTYDALDATKSMRDKLYEQHQDAVLDLMNTIQAPDGGELGDYDAAEVDSIKDLGRGGGTYSPEDTFSPDLTDPYVKEGQLQRQLDIVDADLEAQRDHVNRITGELAHLLAICSK